MNENRAREMARAIISEVREQVSEQTFHVRTVVPHLDRLAQAIQTYTSASYVTHPEVPQKGRYSYDYTEVRVVWDDEKWWVWLSRSSTYTSLPLAEKVIPLSGDEWLHRRDGEIELVRYGIHLRRDPASRVYLAEGHRPQEEILRAANAGPFEVELYRTLIKLWPSRFPVVLRRKNPDERVNLQYNEHKARITLGSGQLLAYLAMWRMME